MLPHSRAYPHSSALAFDPYPPVPTSSQSAQSTRQRSHSVLPTTNSVRYDPYRLYRPNQPAPAASSHLDRPYAPPPNPQVPRRNEEGREDSLPRPGSSQSTTTRENPFAPFRPTSVAESHMERYVPPPLTMPGGSQRSAAEMYQVSRERRGTKPASKAPEILANIASLQVMIETRLLDSSEREKEFRETIFQRLRTLDTENRDLKERIHELQMGQKILPTREELNEAITNQLSPALHEFFLSHNQNLQQAVAPLGDAIWKQTTEGVRAILLELQDTSRREWLKNSTAQDPLMTLMNHLVQALAPLHQVAKVFDAKTIEALSVLPDVVERVAVFEHTMGELHKKIAERQQAEPAPSSPNNATALRDAVRDVIRELQADHPELSRPVRGHRVIEHGKEHLSETHVEDTRITSRDRPEPSGISQPTVPPAARDHMPMLPGVIRDQQCIIHDVAPPSLQMIEPQQSSSLHDCPVSAHSLDVPVQVTSRPTLLPPTPITGSNRLPIQPVSLAKHPHDPDSDAFLNTGESRFSPPATPLGIHDASAGLSLLAHDSDIHAGDMEQDDSSTLTTGLLFPRAPRRPSTTYKKGKVYQRGRFSDLPTPLALATADEANEPPTAPAHSSLSDSTPLEEAAGRVTTQVASAPQLTPVNDNHNSQQQSETPPSGSSQSTGGKKRKVGKFDSVYVKRERLDGLYGAIRHHTRARVNEARGVGIDLLADVNSVSSRSNSSSSRGRKGSAGNRGRKGLSRETAHNQEQATALSQEPVSAVPSTAIPTSAVEPAVSASVSDSPPIVNPAFPMAVKPTEPATEDSIDYIESSDFGRGQPLSAPSLPHPWSTGDVAESQEPTQQTLPTANTVEAKQSTSTDQVDQSTSLALAPLAVSAIPQGGVEIGGSGQKPLRRQPSYRKNQVFMSKEAHEAKMADFKRLFSAYDASDDDDD